MLRSIVREFRWTRMTVKKEAVRYQQTWTLCISRWSNLVALQLLTWSMFCTVLFKCNENINKSPKVMPLAGLHDTLDPWQRIQIKEEAEVKRNLILIECILLWEEKKKKKNILNNKLNYSKLLFAGSRSNVFWSNFKDWLRTKNFLNFNHCMISLYRKWRIRDIGWLGEGIPCF